MQRAGGKFIAQATMTGATMYSLGGFPGIVLDGSNNTIHGEVFEVSDFAPLDRLEGTPSFYDRKIVDTSVGKAWVYFLRPEQVRGLNVVESGAWD